jgi:hypothetical protein
LRDDLAARLWVTKELGFAHDQIAIRRGVQVVDISGRER